MHYTHKRRLCVKYIRPILLDATQPSNCLPHLFRILEALECRLAARRDCRDLAEHQGLQPIRYALDRGRIVSLLKQDLQQVRLKHGGQQLPDTRIYAPVIDVARLFPPLNNEVQPAE
jgi:hypothetical protein